MRLLRLQVRELEGYQAQLDAGQATSAALLGRINTMFITYVKDSWVPDTLTKLARSASGWTRPTPLWDSRRRLADPAHRRSSGTACASVSFRSAPPVSVPAVSVPFIY